MQINQKICTLLNTITTSNATTWGIKTSRWPKFISIFVNYNGSGVGATSVLSIEINGTTVASTTTTFPSYTYLQPYAMIENYKIPQSGTDLSTAYPHYGPSVEHTIKIRHTSNINAWSWAIEVFVKD